MTSSDHGIDMWRSESSKFGMTPRRCKGIQLQRLCTECEETSDICIINDDDWRQVTAMT
jgi:hypothetical protein